MIDALPTRSIRFVTTRDERGAAFMADTYGALTGQAGRLPGHPRSRRDQPDARDRERPARLPSAGRASPRRRASTASTRSRTSSSTSCRCSARSRSGATWSRVRDAAPEMVRKAFKQADDRAARRDVPRSCPRTSPSARPMRAPLRVNTPVDPSPDENQVHRAAHVLASAKHPVVLAGPGVARDGATDALIRFAERLNLPVATTFLGKGVFPDNHPNALGHDRVHGEGLRELRVRPGRRGGGGRATTSSSTRPSAGTRTADKRIVHVHRTVAEVDAHYTLEVGLQGNIGETLDAIGGSAYIHDIRGRDPARSATWCTRSWSAARPTTRSRWRRRASCTTSAQALGRRRHRAVRHGRGEDVDGAPVPDVSPQHLPDLQRPGDDGVLPAGSDRRQARASRAQGAGRHGRRGVRR